MDTSQYSVADFFITDSDDPLQSGSEFQDWYKQAQWATSLYEPVLSGGPIPRTALRLEGMKQPVINMASYNYLGLGSHPQVVEAAAAALREFGTGACGSPMLSGLTTLHEELESRLSRFLGRERTVLFNSGFSGALGCMAGLLRKGDVALLDAKCHISLAEGVRLTGARLDNYAHNDAADLDRLLAKHAGQRRLVVMEGVYSMDGDMGDLPAIAAVARQHGVGILIDEAHSILTAGANGRGVTEHFHAENDVALLYGTFSKAFAGIGGFVSGKADTLNYLRLYASSYGFSCALPPSVVGGLIAALDVAERHPELRQTLAANADYFREQVHKLGIGTAQSTTQVVPLMVGSDRGLLYELGRELRRRGLFVAPVDYPSVPEDEVRFRASVTAAHTRADLDEALNILADVMAPRLKAGR